MKKASAQGNKKELFNYYQSNIFQINRNNQLGRVREASIDPPMGLMPAQIPQFVVLGFDDNQDAEGMEWILNLLNERNNPCGKGNVNTYDGSQIHASFYVSVLDGKNQVSHAVTEQWANAISSGHEIGNHTYSHLQGSKFKVSQWLEEIQRCTDFLGDKIGMKESDILGFRAPYIEYNSDLFYALKEKGFLYDCSISHAFDRTGDEGMSYFWPYTLDNDTPGKDKKVGKFSGLWEMPVYAIMIPPNLRFRYYNRDRVTGLDWNLWYEKGFQMNKEDYLACLIYTLEQRIKGNRAPMILGAHTSIYSEHYPNAQNAGIEERRAAMKEFICYALSKPDVRIVSLRELLRWLWNPIAL